MRMAFVNGASKFHSQYCRILRHLLIILYIFTTIVLSTGGKSKIICSILQLTPNKKGFS